MTKFAMVTHRSDRLGLKKFVVSGNPTDPSFYPPTLKILWTYLC